MYKLWEALKEAKKMNWVDLTHAMNNDSHGGNFLFVRPYRRCFFIMTFVEFFFQNADNFKQMFFFGGRVQTATFNIIADKVGVIRRFLVVEIILNIFYQRRFLRRCFLRLLCRFFILFRLFRCGLRLFALWTFILLLNIFENGRCRRCDILFFRCCRCGIGACGLSQMFFDAFI